DVEEGRPDPVLLQQRDELGRVRAGAVVEGEGDVALVAAAAIDGDACVQELVERRARRGARRRDHDGGSHDDSEEYATEVPHDPRPAGPGKILPQIGCSASISRWTASRSSACASIWRTRSRVSPSVLPISSSDFGSGSPSMP